MTQVITERSVAVLDRNKTAAASESASIGERQSFDSVIKTAHWLTLFLIVAVFATAALIDEVPESRKLITLQLHRSFGLAIWVVTVLRLLWRQFARFPDWPANMSRAMQKAAHSIEYLLYGLLLLQPILGLLYTNARGRQVDLFFLVRLPSLIGRDDELSELLLEAHAFVANALLIVIAGHALWAILHHLIGGERTLNRMLPRH
jgi:cytochrome b561